MRIGHIDLSARITTAQEQLVVLVESLGAQDIEQHILVRNPFLAKRLSVCKGATVGPAVRSVTAAAFLMPAVDLVHAHDIKAAWVGVMLDTLRSIPFLMTHRESHARHCNPLQRLVYSRCETIVCASRGESHLTLPSGPAVTVITIDDAGSADDAIDAENGRLGAERMAAEYLRAYRGVLDRRGVPGVLF